MAQPRRKRTRKHRGNAAGIVERPAHNTRGAAATGDRTGPMTKEQSRTAARQRRLDRFNRPPTWKYASQRAAIAAALFAVLVMFLFKEKPVNAITLAAFMFLLYIPLSYMTDRTLYNRRQKKQQAGRS
jgi:Flp pilus assembly protein TadB